MTIKLQLPLQRYTHNSPLTTDSTYCDPDEVAELEAAYAALNSQYSEYMHASMIDVMQSQNRIIELEAKCSELEREVTHWKSNHADEVKRGRILKDRPDCPLERVQAYEVMKDYQEVRAERDELRNLKANDDHYHRMEVESLEAERDALRAENESIKQLTPWLIKVKLRNMGDSERVNFIAQIMEPFCMACGSELMGRKCNCENDE